jgi:hypothetical protein
MTEMRLVRLVIVMCAAATLAVWLAASGAALASSSRDLGSVAVGHGLSARASATGAATISVGSGSVVEGTSGRLSIRFPVSLSVQASSTVTVAYSTVAGSAKAGVDFLAKSGTLKFVPSAKTSVTPVEQFVTVPVLADKAPDGTETFSVDLANATGGFILANAVGTGTVFDEATGASGLQANIGDASVYEGYSGPDRSMAIPVTLSAAPASPVSVDWVFTGGSALWGTDYKGTQYGTLTFAAGQRSALLPVSVIPDADVGPDTTIVVTIENPSGAVIGRSSGTMTILDGQGGTPDLAVSNSLSQVWERTPFVYAITIHNSGNGPAPDVSLDASDPGITVTSTLTPGWSCGNLGGFRSPHEGWYCNSSVPVFQGSSVTLQMEVMPGSAAVYPETVTVGTTVAQQNNVSHSFSDQVDIGVPPVPSVPQNLQVSQTGPDLYVSWTAPATGLSSLLHSTITATPPVGSPFTLVVPPGVTSGVLPNVAPSTTYSVTVTSTSYTGTGPAAAVSFTTEAPTVPPGAPQSVSASWTSTDSPASLSISWGTTDPGNSPIDNFEIKAVAVTSRTTSPLDAVIPAPATAYTFYEPNNSVSWRVTVRAHNAAGWGPWSKAVVVPALD